jgi:DNA-binding NarL/FixJ family response regulator
MSEVLVVDDQDENRELIAALLRYRSHQVIEAADGTEALDAAARHQPALVITDIFMPAMDGFGLVRALRAQPDFSATPIMFNTARILDGSVEKMARALNVAVVLCKPYDLETFFAALDQTLGGPLAMPPLVLTLANGRAHGAGPGSGPAEILSPVARIAQERGAREPPGETLSRLGMLTPRERDVLSCMLRGLSNKLIAYDLGISQRTVESHRAHVMAKMRAPNFATLMRMMVVTGQGPR